LVIVHEGLHVIHGYFVEKLVSRFFELIDEIQGKSTIVVFFMVNLEAAVVTGFAFDL
jgi:hypothetical protein